MSRTIDEKVVSMQFDNREFEKNVQTTMGTVGKLKQCLNFTGATKGLENISSAARNVDMSGLSSGVEAVRLKFSALQVFAVNALNDIYRTVTNVGKRMVSALTIDPIKTGFQEYETQINAVQTILANTQSKGTTIKDVNGALDELNTYADKTIYNFTEMTRNIGTFTAAGVDLDKSVTSIKGIANLAAVSGSTSQQASTAMYQLSQALAAGKVQLMDWNSVVNAGMGGQVFQDALKRTAKNMGKDVDGMIKKYGSFRESLTKGEWLTADVLTETLTQLSGAYTEADLLGKGYTKEQAKEILELAKTAEDAATKVKTFTQLWDTLKEAAQSGWTQTWEIIVGDFEEAKALLTEVSDTIGAIIGKSAESRNALLQGWKDMGGRNDLVDSFRNIFQAIGAIAKPIGEAFKEIFPAATAEQLFNITKGIKEFTEKLKIGDETADKLKRTFKGLFSIVDMFRKIITTVAKVIGSLFTGGGVTGIADLILTITASIGDFFTSLNKGFKMDGVVGGLTAIVGGISEAVGKIAKSLKGFGQVLADIGNFILNIFKNIWDGLTTVFTWIKDNVSAGDIFAGLTGGGIFLVAKKLAGVFGKIKEVIEKFTGGKGDDGPGIGEKISGILDSVGESLQSFTNGIKVASLVSIAVSIAILSSALKTLSTIKIGDTAKSLVAMGIMFTMLTRSFNSITRALGIFEPKGVIRAGIAIMLMAKAIDILADAMVKLSDLSLPEIGKGLIAIGGGILGLTKGLKAINGVKISVSTSIALIALAESYKMLADAMVKFGSMSWGEIARGLTAMGGALGEFVFALKGLDKFTGIKSLLGSGSLLIAVQSLDELSENLKKFGKMKWDEIGRGLTAMAGALAEIGTVTGTLGKLTGFSGILGAGSLVLAVESLGDLADGLKKFGEMKWDNIGRGLTAMGGALAELATVTGTLGKLTGFSGILGGSALVIAVQSLGDLADGLKKFGEMSWDEIGHGLTAMGGALGELAGVTGALGKLTGFSGILGAGSLVLAVESLGALADAFKKFGSMSWDEIKKGLTGMGLALLEVGGISGGLGYLTNIGGILGGASIWVAVQGLGDLADAFKKFGSMSWDEIKAGLAAMGGALGELALGGFLNTLSILGSYSISEMAEPLGVLADSVKKWSGVTLPEHLGFQLTSLGNALMSFTFAGFGADALATAAPAVGTMADSVKKWSGVTLPEGLTTNLSTLADGIKSFTFGGLGAGALATSAPAIGTMADSVKKWQGVSIPEGLNTNLSSLANGIKSFSFAFVGGWSLSAVAGPLGELAGDVSKWKGVTIPTGLSDQLKSLAGAIKSFSFAFMGGWSLSSLDGPLGKLADSVKKWQGVSVPDTLSNQLKSLAGAVKSFSFAFVGGWSISSLHSPLGKLADAVKKWNGVTMPEGLGGKLKSLASGVKAFAGIGDVLPATTGFSAIASSAKKLSGVNFSSIASGLNMLSSSLKTFGSSSNSIKGVGSTIVNNIVSPLKQASLKLSSIGSNLINSLSKGMKSSSGGVTSAINSIVSKMTKSISDKKKQFDSAGSSLGTQLANGIKKTSSKSKAAVTSVLSTAVSGIKGYYDNFYSAGQSLVNGFAAGISANTFKASAKAKAMANAAEKAAKKALDINSPSKVFRKIGTYVPEGFAQGISKFGDLVSRSTRGMTDNAIEGTKNAVSRIAEAINNDIDSQPTIRPVLDLSNISSAAGTINGMFGSPSVGVLSNINSINSMMNDRNQNGVNNEVVSAIKNLEKTIGNMSGDTYNVNGVTYDDGSNITDAVKAIVRAAKVERRT